MLARMLSKKNGTTTLEDHSAVPEKLNVFLLFDPWLFTQRS
jgi:hypothetical protein